MLMFVNNTCICYDFVHVRIPKCAGGSWIDSAKRSLFPLIHRADSLKTAIRCMDVVATTYLNTSCTLSLLRMLETYQIDMLNCLFVELPFTAELSGDHLNTR